MIATEDPEQFKRAPIGTCFVGSTFATWCGAPDLVGVSLWGTLDERAVREMMALGDFVRHPTIAPRRRSLIDARAVERVDSEVLLAFTAMARQRVPEWVKGMDRQAMVVPDGLVGILIAGTLPALGASHPLRFTQELDAAIEFIDHAAVREAHTAVAAIVEETQASSAFLGRVRAQLRRDLATATIGSVAAAMGMSTRTLQRELTLQGTSFSDELRRVRVATAEVLLVHSTLKIEAIAAQVGFGSSSRMSLVLRRELNRTASELRAR